MRKPKSIYSSDKQLEIVAVRFGASFLGLLSANMIFNDQTPTLKEFVPIYLSAFLSIYAFKKNKWKVLKLISFAKEYPVSFLANLIMPLFGLILFLIGQFSVFSQHEFLQPILAVLQGPYLSLFSALCGWLFVHFGTNLIYQDLTDSFLAFTIDKYLLAPADGWCMGLLVYYFLLRQSPV